jgi:hypothetical protein
MAIARKPEFMQPLRWSVFAALIVAKNYKFEVARSGQFG